MHPYRNNNHRQSIRLKNWDYGSPGFYFVTVCTKDREHFFGEVTCENTRPLTDYHCLMPWPWAGSCGGGEGTHDYASLPPAAPTAHVPGMRLNEITAIVRLTPIGEVAYQNWLQIPQHFPFVSLDEFVIMPNHIHGILCFKKPGYREMKPNVFGPQSGNLGSVIRNYKGATKAYATAHGLPLEWQARYHDDVITSGKELDNIRLYIRNNPKRWMERNRDSHEQTPGP